MYFNTAMNYHGAKCSQDQWTECALFVNEYEHRHNVTHHIEVVTNKKKYRHAPLNSAVFHLNESTGDITDITETFKPSSDLNTATFCWLKNPSGEWFDFDYYTCENVSIRHDDYDSGQTTYTPMQLITLEWDDNVLKLLTNGSVDEDCNRIIGDDDPLLLNYLRSDVCPIVTIYSDGNIRVKS